MTTKQILIATKNKNKVREYREMLQPLGYEVKTLIDFPSVPKVNETGRTFEENATLKALALIKDVKIPVLADDSGLQVTALNGAPGVHSARYAGDHDDKANNEKLLNNLASSSDRSANFTTCLILLYPDLTKIVVHGNLSGQITIKAHGQNGFGYDPYFYVPDKKMTLAEMSGKQKNEISHRGRAMAKMMKIMQKLQ